MWLGPTDLVAVDTHVMTSDEGLEDDHPAGIGGSLKQRVSHLRDVDVGGVGGWHQVCNTATKIYIIINIMLTWSSLLEGEISHELVCKRRVPVSLVLDKCLHNLNSSD